METLNKIAMVTAKIIEVIHWIGAILAILGLLIFSINPGWVIEFFINNNILELTANSFSIAVFNNGEINLMAVKVFCVTAVILYTLMAMIARNIYLTLRTAANKTWFAKGKTPFQNDIVRMIREIGIFYIMMTLVGLIASIIGRMLIGYDAAEISVGVGNAITGVIILCLSQIFVQGVALQEEVDGMI